MVKFSEKPLKVLATASTLPGPPISNQQLFDAIHSQCLKSGKEQAHKKVRRAKSIARLIGVKQRHMTRRQDVAISKPTIDAPELGAQTLAKLLDDNASSVKDVDYLITHTASPHTQIPGNSAWIAERAALACPYMELRQACTGFANALFVASGLLGTSDEINTIAITGMEVGTVFFNLTHEFLDDEQLLNFMQMGDGAGGVLLGAYSPDSDAEVSASTSTSGGTGVGNGIISDIYHGHIGIGRDPGLYLTGAGSSDLGDNPDQVPHFRHHATQIKDSGADLFAAAIQCIVDRGFSLEEFDWIIPQQVSAHIGQLLSDHTRIPVERFVVDAPELGNLGSAAIWISLDRLIRSGKLLRGQKVLVLGAEATKYMYGGFVYTHQAAS